MMYRLLAGILALIFIAPAVAQNANKSKSLEQIRGTEMTNDTMAKLDDALRTIERIG